MAESAVPVSKVIIPIGYDCHPAIVLNKLGLRWESLPFDWLDTVPYLGIKYVHENLKDEFGNFLKGLRKNDKNQVYSEYYPYSIFFHYEDLIENSETYDKLVRRCNRLLNYVKTAPCIYLFNVTSENIAWVENVNFLANSVRDFVKFIKEEDHLCIYIKYYESIDENKENCEKLIEELSKLDKVNICRYILKKNEYGFSGDESDYLPLLYDLGFE